MNICSLINTYNKLYSLIMNHTLNCTELLNINLQDCIDNEIPYVAIAYCSLIICCIYFGCKWNCKNPTNLKILPS